MATPVNQNDSEAWMMYRDALAAQGTLETAHGQMTATAWHQLATQTAEAENRLAVTAAAKGTEQAITQGATLQAAQAIATTTTQAQYALASATAQMQATQDSLALQSTLQAQAVTQTAQAAEAALTELALIRERKLNTLIAIAPWIAGAGIFGLSLTVFWLWARTEIARRKALRDENGRVTHILDVTDGQTRVVATDRMPSAALILHPDGRVSTPEAETQAQVNATTLALLAEMLRQQKTMGSPGRLIKQLNHMNAGRGYRILEPGQTHILSPRVEAILEGEWRNVDE